MYIGSIYLLWQFGCFYYYLACNNDISVNLSGTKKWVSNTCKVTCNYMFQMEMAIQRQNVRTAAVNIYLFDTYSHIHVGMYCSAKSKFDLRMSSELFLHSIHLRNYISLCCIMQISCRQVLNAGGLLQYGACTASLHHCDISTWSGSLKCWMCVHLRCIYATFENSTASFDPRSDVNYSCRDH